LNNSPAIFLFASANPDQTILAAKTIASLIYGQAGTDPRDFLGKKIYSIPLPAPHAADDTAAPAHALYLTTSSGYVALSTDSSIIENFLRSTGTPAKPLRETVGLNEAAEHIGGAGAGLFGYENNREIMRTAFTLLKSSDSAAGLGSMAALPKNFRDWADFSLLPDYDSVSKYFYFSVFGGSTTVDGISFKAFAPRPPQLN
jgi:hypothetical protein